MDHRNSIFYANTTFCPNSGCAKHFSGACLLTIFLSLLAFKLQLRRRSF